ncbi:Aspartokinase [Clostridiales bacterium CHKCI006]|nr:Aspartokinase [Clostridiales bacterium CHKCI006]
MKVLKFGGSSVATIEKIQSIAAYLKERAKQEKMVVVVSAMGKTTNHLIELAHAISANPNQRELDRLLSIGEQQTIALLAMALWEIEVPAVSLTAYQVGIRTTGYHTKSTIKQVETETLLDQLDSHEVVIVAGFQGINYLNDITTLGRGGSDTTAVALAAALGCDCEIYTDVAGIYTMDPRVYPQAKKIKEISYYEMMEMASLGSKVMEPRSVELGQKYGVKIYVGKTLSDEEGTYIMNSELISEEKVISAASLNDKIIHVKLLQEGHEPSVVAHVFKVISDHQVNVDVITQHVTPLMTEVEFTCSQEEEAFLAEAMNQIKSELPDLKVSLNTHVAKVSVVGIGMRHAVGVAAKIFQILEENHIEFKQVATSEISISLIVDLDDGKKACQAICAAFDL